MARQRHSHSMRARVATLRDWGLVVHPDTHAWWGTHDSLFAEGGGFQVVFAKDVESVSYGRGEFRTPKRFYFLWSGWPHGAQVGPAWTRARLTLDMVVERGELTCKTLLVQPWGDEAVTTGLLRNIKLKPLIEGIAGPRAAFRLVQKRGGGLERVPAILTDEGREAWLRAYEGAAEQQAPRRGKRVSDERLREVADIYRSAQAMGQPPTQSVAAALHTSRSNAGRWVGEARRRGLLNQAPGPGRAGES